VADQMLGGAHVVVVAGLPEAEIQVAAMDVGLPVDAARVQALDRALVRLSRPDVAIVHSAPSTSISWTIDAPATLDTNRSAAPQDGQTALAIQPTGR
jgi:hypothetical protein